MSEQGRSDKNAKSAARERRLAEALRANLKRRKRAKLSTTASGDSRTDAEGGDRTNKR